MAEVSPPSGDGVQLGDDPVTNTEILQRGIDEKVANSI
jgi:enolase